VKAENQSGNAKKKKAKSDTRSQMEGENCVEWGMKTKRNASRNNGTAKVSRPNADGRAPIRIMDLDYPTTEYRIANTVYGLPTTNYPDQNRNESRTKTRANRALCWLGEKEIYSLTIELRAAEN